MPRSTQGNNLVNIMRFAAQSPCNLKILIDKLFKRFFDEKGTLTAEENLKWINSNCSDYALVLKNIDSALWEQSLKNTVQFKQKSREILSKINYDLGGGGIYPVLYFLTKLTKPKCVVETGVAAGFSSQMFLKGLHENGGGVLYSSDLSYFRLADPQKYIGILVDDKLKDNWRLFVEGDKVSIPKIKKEISGKINIFHYDSDKSYKGRAFAVRQLESLFSENTIIIFDDIQDNSHFYDYLKSRKINYYRVFEFENKYVGIINLPKPKIA